MEKSLSGSSSPSPPSYSCCTHEDQINSWIKVQNDVKKRLVTEDVYSWALPPSIHEADSGEGGEAKQFLRYVGGVDISFAKEDPTLACGTLVVLDLRTLDVVYEDYSVARLHVPYVPGFLAFREAPILLGLLERMKADSHPFYPQVLMVDGNGLLHPRGFGLACHLGVLIDIPTIGIGKNLHHVEGLTQSRVRELLEHGSCNELVDLVGCSGHSLGMIPRWQYRACFLSLAMKSTLGTLKPIFISIGHRISLATAVKIVKLTCKYRVPEPVRQMLPFSSYKELQHLALGTNPSFQPPDRRFCSWMLGCLFKRF